MPQQISEPFNLPLATETLQNAPFGIIVIDNAGQIVWVNKTFGIFLNIECDSLTGKNTSAISLPELTAVLNLDEEIVIAKSGELSRRWLRCWHQSLEIDDNVVGSTYFVIDVSDQHRLQQEFLRIQKELEAKSTRDALTGLLNRRGLMQILEAQVSRSRRYQNPLSLIRMHLGDYKLANGNVPSKNQVLMAIGHLFNDQLRWVDFCGRLDDDDFLLILPETNNAAAIKLVDKIKACLQDLVIGKDEHKVILKACFGITSWASGDDQGKLLERAEQSMSAVKAVEMSHNH